MGGGGYRLVTVSTQGEFIYSAASLEHQATGTMTYYPTQSHYPAIEKTSPCPIIILPGARLGSDKYQFKSYWFDSTRIRKCVVI